MVSACRYERQGTIFPAMANGPLKRLVREIHRKSLWQVLGIYVVASWGVLSVVDTLGGALNLPDWFPSVALGLLIVGLPVVLATAFVQDGGADGVTRDLDLARDPTDAALGAASGLFTWRNAALSGVGAFALLGFVGTGWVLFGGGIRNTTDDDPTIERSVAVLPFVNMSGDSNNEYFSDGITEELLNALAHLPDLRVPGRTSSFAFKDGGLTIRQIADTLDVAHVLEGSVRRQGETVLITAQLIDAQTDAHLWSDTFERELTDIFAIQREIATAIADQLQVSLSGAEQARLVGEGTANTEAYEAYLRGRYFWNQRTAESIQTAISEFQRAVDLDSNYAEAYSGLADSYLIIDNYVFRTMPDYRTNSQLGLAAAQRAVSLRPDLGMAHASLGFGLWMVGDWENADRELERAIELNPGYAIGHMWRAWVLSSTGRADEAVGPAQRALELDPVSRVISLVSGEVFLFAGRMEEAIEQLRKTIGLAPEWANPWFDLGHALLIEGRYDEGLEAWLNYARFANLDVAIQTASYQAMVRYRETGEPHTFPDHDENPRGQILMYAESGQPDQAIELFEALVLSGAYGWAGSTHSLPTGDLLGDDLRYQALLEEAGITW